MLNTHGTKSYKIDDGDFPEMDGGEFQGAVIFVIIVVCIIICIF